LGGLSINPFSEKRTLNTIEVAHIYHSNAHRGAKIMIKNRWMEEAPQMEERNQRLN
jgi:hypothetical protein